VAPTRLARLKNISITPRVALLIDEYDEDWTRLWYILVRGEAKLVSAVAERNRALGLLSAKYPHSQGASFRDESAHAEGLASTV
jgi:hypothetical protein